MQVLGYKRGYKPEAPVAPLTDEQIRRDVLMRNGWRQDEIHRWLAMYPKPTTLLEQGAILRERWLDALYAIVVTLHIPALARRLGLQPRRWVRDRES